MLRNHTMDSTVDTDTMRSLRELQVRETELHEFLCRLDASHHGSSYEMAHALTRLAECFMWARKHCLHSDCNGDHK